MKQERAAKFEDSLRRRDTSLTEAKQMVESASIRQVEIPALLDSASQAVAALFAAMKDVNTRRRRAAEALAIVDRVDYDVELEEVGEEQRQYDRDPSRPRLRPRRPPRGSAGQAVAGRHGPRLRSAQELQSQRLPSPGRVRVRHGTRQCPGRPPVPSRPPSLRTPWFTGSLSSRLQNRTAATSPIPSTKWPAPADHPANGRQSQGRP